MKECPFSCESTRWARSVYEQVPLFWLRQLALKKDFILLCGGSLGWMPATHLKETLSPSEASSGAGRDLDS